MFDFAFSEIALIGVVALVVIGPERLPRVARTAGVVVGRMQRYAATVRADIAREVELSELRRVQGEFTDAARSFESGVRDSLAAAENQFESSRQAVMTGPQPDLSAAASTTTSPSVTATPYGADSHLATAAIPAPEPLSAAPSARRPPGAPAGADAPEVPSRPALPAHEAYSPSRAQASLFAPAEAPPGLGLTPPADHA